MIPVLANDSDPEGTKLTVTARQLVGTKGLVTINALGSFDNTVTYNPNGKFESLGVGQTATDTFQYTVKDEDGYTSVGTVTVTIDGLNDAPTAVNDSSARVARNGTVVISVLSNDTDIDGDTLQVASVNLVTLGTQAWLSETPTTRSPIIPTASSTTCSSARRPRTALRTPSATVTSARRRRWSPLRSSAPATRLWRLTTR